MDQSSLCIVSGIVGVICALIGGGICQSKGRSFGEGFLLGLLLGIIGIIIVAVLPTNNAGLEKKNITDGTSKKCPYCAELIKSEARVCRYCGKELTQGTTSVIYR